MKKLIAALAASAAFAAGAAFADTMANAYENTIVITGADGSSARYHFNADNTFELHAGETHATGTYEIDGDQICLTPTGGERGCTDYVGDKNVGDTWEQTAIDGSTISVTLEAGR